MIMLTGIVIIELLMNILTVFRVHSIRIIKNSFRVSTPLIEKENITNFVTKLHVLVLEIKMIEMKYISQNFHVRRTFSNTGRTLLEQRRALNGNIKGLPNS